MSETLVIRLRRANEFIRALWAGDLPPAKDSACELCAEAATEIERLQSLVRKLRTAWFEHHLRFNAPEREWEDKLDAAIRTLHNADNLFRFNDQTERILHGEQLNLTPHCLADMDAGEKRK
jgi:hypothetical protein